MEPDDQFLKPKATILVVDDDDALRKSLLSILEAEHYRALGAVDANEAADILARETGPIDLLLLDILLPGLSGPELARELLEGRPNVKVIFMSGGAQPQVLDTVHLVKNERLIQKPCTRDTVLAAIRDALRS